MRAAIKNPSKGGEDLGTGEDADRQYKDEGEDDDGNGQGRGRGKGRGKGKGKGRGRGKGKGKGRGRGKGKGRGGGNVETQSEEQQTTPPRKPPVVEPERSEPKTEKPAQPAKVESTTAKGRKRAHPSPDPEEAKGKEAPGDKKMTEAGACFLFLFKDLLSHLRVCQEPAKGSKDAEVTSKPKKPKPAKKNSKEDLKVGQPT